MRDIDRKGAVRTSVTLLGQDMGNTLLVNVYTVCVSSAVLFGWMPRVVAF
jgi:hypothetical protein